MSHAWRFPAILALSLLFGAPALQEIAMGGDLLTAGSRYAAALALAWLGVGGIARLVDGYALRNQHELDAARALLAREEAEAAVLAQLAARESEAVDAESTAFVDDLSPSPAMS